MAEDKKLFYPKIEPGDIQQIHPDGGGVVMTKDFKALMGETNGDVVDNLNMEGYNGYIDTIPNNANGIWVYSEKAAPLEGNIPVGNENRTSIIEPAPVPVVEKPPLPQYTRGFIIGDSQTTLIKSNSKKLDPITKEGELWKVGWNMSQLNTALENSSTYNYIGHLFINIGTNDGFNAKSSFIDKIIANAKIKFPNATLYLIKGSIGWGGNAKFTTDTLDKFAKVWESKGVKVLKNAIGYSKTHPGTKTPGIIAVGKEIDDILSNTNSTDVPTTPENPVEKLGKVNNNNEPVYTLQTVEVISEAANDDKLATSSGDEGIYEVDFSSLPDRETDVNPLLLKNKNQVSN